MDFGCAKRFLGSAVLLLTLAACGGHPVVPVLERHQPPPDRLLTHTVVSGDTLYTVAWVYGKDWRQLAALNGLNAPYTIQVGQKLKLEGSVPVVRARPKTTAKPSVRPPSAESRTASGSPSPGRTGKWRWPASGHVLTTFGSGSPPHKGIDIAGAVGTPVLAANDGTVVYAGSGIRGYGKLLIVKHSNEYLSAYAHNQRLLVSEGAQVRGGQRIAEFGSSGTDSVKLHFEVRRDGKPIDPRTVLPAARQ